MVTTQAPEHPAKKVWRKFRVNVTGMAGLIIVLIGAVTALFCYLIMPDNSPDANEMHLEISTSRPGTVQQFLLLPATIQHEQRNWLVQAFTGFEKSYKSIPVDTFWTDGTTVFYKEHSDDPETADTQRMPIQKFFADTDVMPAALTARIEWLEKNNVETRKYYLGTDRFGRDLLSRILAGTRISMAVGLIAVFISLVIGITLGAVAGFFRGKIDDLIMWFINIIWSIPTLLLVIAITMALGKGFTQVFIAVGLTMWVEVARVVRGQIFAIRETEFIEAGKALGYGNARIIIKHVLPNILSHIMVIAAANFASAILLEAGLSFLGMGAQPPTPSWGMMIKENYGYIIVDAAYLAVWPGVAIMLLVLAFTWLGNGLRDALDAREGMGIRA